MSMCPKCGDFFYRKECACRPFYVFDEDGDEHEVHAFDAYFAALKYAQDSNECNDYYLMDNPVEITVKDGDELKKFRISAEPDVHYSAHEIRGG